MDVCGSNMTSRNRLDGILFLQKSSVADTQSVAASNALTGIVFPGL